MWLCETLRKRMTEKNRGYPGGRVSRLIPTFTYGRAKTRPTAKRGTKKPRKGQGEERKRKERSPPPTCRRLGAVLSAERVRALSAQQLKGFHSCPMTTEPVDQPSPTGNGPGGGDKHTDIIRKGEGELPVWRTGVPLRRKGRCVFSRRHGSRSVWT